MLDLAPLGLSGGVGRLHCALYLWDFSLGLVGFFLKYIFVHYSVLDV